MPKAPNRPDRHGQRIEQLNEAVDKLETFANSTEAKDVIRLQALTAIVQARTALVTAGGRRPGVNH